MKEVDKNEVQKLEQTLGIRFIALRKDLLVQLNGQLEKLSENLGVPPYTPEVPKRGFLDKPLSTEQDKRINQLIGHQYATSAVELQDKLTIIPIKENLERMVSLPALFSKNNVELSLSSVV